MDVTAYRTPYREYAGAIYELAEEGIPVIQARIADWLAVSRASVSEMIHRMAEDGLVTTADEIALTEEGRHLAEVVVRRHRLAERFLSEVLGLPWVKVHAEAEVWEHVISDDVEKAMWAALGDPKTCPHGNPIPGAGYKPPKIKAISRMEPGEARVLERISEELELDSEIMGFLDDSGLRPGAELELVMSTPHGAHTVKVTEHDQVGIDQFMADRLFVAVG
ncbi:MAG: metal-dependent transcriptional regulator [Acidimicrobiia bacterium]|nr:metal-dependent transcriptional regulator [Acidimicrobiia bacterium]